MQSDRNAKAYVVGEVHAVNRTNFDEGIVNELRHFRRNYIVVSDSGISQKKRALIFSKIFREMESSLSILPVTVNSSSLMKKFSAYDELQCSKSTRRY